MAAVGLESKEACVFETPDEGLEEGPVRPSVERAPKPAEGSEDVVVAKIDAARAMERFKGKELVADSVDFSGRLSGRAGAHGYIVRSEYSLAAPGEPETPEQRFNRLQSEVKELLGELEAAQTAGAAPAASTAEGSVSAATLAAEAALLQQQLQRVRLDALLGAGADALKASAGLQDDLNKRLLAEIAKTSAAPGAAAAAAAPASAAGTSGAAGAGGDAVTYELFYRPEAAKYAQLAALGSLEQRLGRLEASLGTESLAPLAADLDAPGAITLNAAVVQLTRRIVSLSAEDVADAKQRVDFLLQQVETLKAKAGEVAAAASPSEHASRVAELHALAKRWDASATALPDVIERLQTLKRLHERGAEFGQTLTELETVQAQLTEAMRLQGTVLQTVETSLATNLATIEANFKSVDARIEALQANVAKLG